MKQTEIDKSKLDNMQFIETVIISKIEKKEDEKDADKQLQEND